MSSKADKIAALQGIAPILEEYLEETLGGAHGFVLCVIDPEAPGAEPDTRKSAMVSNMTSVGRCDLLRGSLQLAEKARTTHPIPKKMQ